MVSHQEEKKSVKDILNYINNHMEIDSNKDNDY